MIVFEFKAKSTKQQYQKIDEAIRITQFIRNRCLRFWMDNQNVKYYDLNKHTAVLAIVLIVEKQLENHFQLELMFVNVGVFLTVITMLQLTFQQKH